MFNGIETNATINALFVVVITYRQILIVTNDIIYGSNFFISINILKKIRYKKFYLIKLNDPITLGI